MLVAQFSLGPFDGERLVLPLDKPLPRYMLPERLPELGDSIIIEHFYLYAGWHEQLALYLYDENFSTVLGG